MEAAEWLHGNRTRILLEYSKLAETGLFPSYETLGHLDRRRLFEREIDGLIAFAERNPEALSRIEQVHSQQAKDVTAAVEVGEQIRFLDAKIAAVRGMVEGDTAGAKVRDSVVGILERARSYYVARLHKLEGP